MKLITLSVFLSILMFLKSSTAIIAIVDPRVFPNNKFGIHIQDESDLEKANELINSTGGDWGYVTVVIREDERKTDYWQQVFDKMRRLHLIPIVRLASEQYDNAWHKIRETEIDNWVNFLNSLNWVIENRYIIVGNEPNHAREWGGELNPEEYSDVYIKIAKKLKGSNDNYFLMLAGLDASAPNAEGFMDEEDYLKRVFGKNTDLKLYVDGLASHSYPNPEFSGSPDDTQRGGIRTFNWEKELFKSLGVEKDLPIFITETGWAHSGFGDKKYKDENTIKSYYTKAYREAWNNNDVVAVTPFILNYKSSPFNIFSWISVEGKTFSFHEEVKSIIKVKGMPSLITDAEVVSRISPPFFKDGEKKYGFFYIKNTGQTIWRVGDTFTMEDEGEKIKVSPFVVLSEVRPGTSTLASYDVVE